MSFYWNSMDFPNYGQISWEEIVGYAKKNYWIAGACVAGIGGYMLFSKFRAGGVCRCRAELHGKTVVITGANSGLGKEAAVQLAKRGARVILACRDIMKGERAASVIRQKSSNGNVFCLQLDLASFKSIKKFVAHLLYRQEAVNILLNNAAVMACPQMKTEEGFELQFGVNYLGHVLLTQMLLDQLKTSAPSRIINVTSGAHKGGKINWSDLNYETGYSPFTSYQQSKLALILYTRALSDRLADTNVTVNAVDPGIVETTGFQKAGTSWLRFIGVWLMCKVFCKTPAEGCQTYIHCAVCPELEKISGKYFKDCKLKQPSLETCDIGDEEKLWDISMKLVGLG